MNDEHVARLKQGVAAWNAWRDGNPDIPPDLSKADLRGENLGGADRASGANLRGADFSRADLRGANLSEAHLWEANLSEANLSKANLSGADFGGADLRLANLVGAGLPRAYLAGLDLSRVDFSGADLFGADLIEADLYGANLRGADLSRAKLNRANLRGANLSGANLSEADLRHAHLVDTDLTGADLTGCHIYGISAWGLKLEGAKQQDLVITPTPSRDEPVITVDNIEVAQFIYLLLHNEKIRDVIDTITSKAVLILGRFTDERKAVLDALREELRKRNYLPIMFDFNVPATRNITETISLLARMARFVVADITDAKGIPVELVKIVPHFPSVPVQPLLLEGSAEYDMFEDLKPYPWVLKTYVYPSSKRLIANIAKRVIGPAERYVGPSR